MYSGSRAMEPAWARLITLGTFVKSAAGAWGYATVLRRCELFMHFPNEMQRMKEKPEKRLIHSPRQVTKCQKQNIYKCPRLVAVAAVVVVVVVATYPSSGN